MAQLLFLALFLCGLHPIRSLNVEGHACYHVSKKLAGKCKILQKCPSIIEDIQEGNSIFLQECGLTTTQPIVCCPNEVVGSRSRSECLKYSRKHAEKCGSEGGLADEFPHMVLLGYSDGTTNETRYLCTGSLVSYKFVLTALSCTNLSGLGGPKIARLADGSREVDVLEVVKSPPKSNLALVELKESVNVKPACLFLNKSKTKDEHRVLTTWGFEGLDVVGNIIRRNCLYPSPKSTTALCSRPQPLTWQADLGSPIHIKNEEDDCDYSLYGVLNTNSSVIKFVSLLSIWGRIRNVTEIVHNVPVVFKFAKVESDLQWIENVVWP